MLAFSLSQSSKANFIRLILDNLIVAFPARVFLISCNCLAGMFNKLTIPTTSADSIKPLSSLTSSFFHSAT